VPLDCEEKTASACRGSALSLHSSVIPIRNEFYQVAFRKEICGEMEDLQEDLDAWLIAYNHDARTRG